MIYTTEYDYELGNRTLELRVNIEYYCHKEEKRTLEYPGCPAYIEIDSVHIVDCKENEQNICLKSEVAREIEKELFDKVDWADIIGEHLSNEEDYYKSEYYDRIREERRCGF